MDRRAFLKLWPGVAGLAALSDQADAAGLPKTKITRIRYYKTPTDAAGRPNVRQPLFNQSTNVVLVETDAGLVGVGEGGSDDTMEQCASMLIGEDPFRTDRLWQIMYRGYFYPAGREKVHALGALDVALWDLKGKALGVPVYQLLGGLSRDYIECYSTGFPAKGSPAEVARACIEAGFRAYRISTDGRDPVLDRFDLVNRTYELCKQVRQGVGKDGAWCIDFHTELDMPDAVTLANLIEPLRPYFVEDLIRSENPGVYRTLRKQVKVPIAVGEQFGPKWDWNMLIEEHLIDYARVTIPNVGGITDFQKIAALCETHYIGLVPHFTGPISEAAMVHCAAVFPGPVLMELVMGGTRSWPYLKQGYDFKNGKLWPNDRPGLGVEVDTSQLQLIGDYQERYTLTPLLRRPDGSYTNW
ncbi:MAG: mandelate racemase/muconate lactonizing enzyme family protein [Bryobacteraceae bacterium]|nr:mandelate racemase/muconate lactonizing enzyme family protein [Bryobacteraceae bacterium]MDW8377755.1 mandelate racemase/muconate lactonizing enzyme family protein [Bryobacterales bacterium]